MLKMETQSVQVQSTNQDIPSSAIRESQQASTVLATRNSNAFDGREKVAKEPPIAKVIVSEEVEKPKEQQHKRSQTINEVVKGRKKQIKLQNLSRDSTEKRKQEKAKHVEKRETAVQLVKNISKETEQRKLREKIAKKLQSKRQAEIEKIENFKQEKRESEAKQKKEEHLSLLKEKSQQRVENINRQKALILSPSLPEPYFKKIERQAELEENRLKIDYSQDRTVRKTMDHSPEQINYHRSWYYDYKKADQVRRKQEIWSRAWDLRCQQAAFKFHGNVLGTVQQEMQRSSGELKEKAEESNRLRKKAEMYSSLVQEFHAPKIDQRKAIQVQQARKKDLPRLKQRNPSLRSNHSKSLHSLSALNRSSTQRKSHEQRQSKTPLRKIYPNYLHQDVRNRTDPKKLVNINWNAQNSRSNSTITGKLDRMQAMATRMEVAAMRKQNMVESMTGVYKEKLVAEQEANDLMIGSVRAKIALLNSMS